MNTMARRLIFVLTSLAFGGCGGYESVEIAVDDPAEIPASSPHPHAVCPNPNLPVIELPDENVIIDAPGIYMFSQTAWHRTITLAAETPSGTQVELHRRDSVDKGTVFKPESSSGAITFGSNGIGAKALGATFIYTSGKWIMRSWYAVGPVTASHAPSVL